MRRSLVTGAGGFIGGHLVTALKQRGDWVRGVDIKHPEFGPTDADEFELLDLRDLSACMQATSGIDDVYALAADMGGMGYISQGHASIFRNNTLIDMNTIEAARLQGCQRLLYTSSACVYPQHLQTDAEAPALREHDVFPAQPQEAYGWEKLFGELMLGFTAGEHPLEMRVARFHNIYGPSGTWTGGREKAPAAICRKVAAAQPGEEIEIWGDGLQTRSFCFVGDCVEGILRLMHSGFTDPVNLGSDEAISIGDLTRLVIEISGKKDLGVRHVPGPQGVRGRNSDNTLITSVLGWAPETGLRKGLAQTYAWVLGQVEAAATEAAPAAVEVLAR